MKKTLVAFLIGLTLPATTIADTLKPVQNDVSTRIIGGEPANTSDWKFIASLVRKGQPILPTGSLLLHWSVKDSQHLLVTSVAVVSLVENMY
uniref:hypothetical protein n=1 Tax=Vibrio parahaemolyticus TaxID=670 RepID=UPI00358EBE17